MRTKTPLLLIILIAIAAPVFSTALYFFWRPDSFTHFGELLPPQKIQQNWKTADGELLDFNQWRGKWTLLQLSDDGCDEQCLRRLCKMRQLRLMSFGGYFHLQRAWLIVDDFAPPQLIAAAACGEEKAKKFTDKKVNVSDGVIVLRGDDNPLPAPGAGFGRGDYLYLLDPAGFLVMRFSPALGIYEVRKDLKRLLKLSKGRRDIINKN